MCRQEARQSARTSSGQAKLRTFSMANVFNAKVNESWCMLARFNVEKLNNENQYRIPLCMGSQKKRLATPPGKPSILVIFPISWLGQCLGNCKKRFFDCRNLGGRLTRTWHNPGNKLKQEQEPCWRKPGKTRHNPAELTWREPRTQRNLAEPGGAAEPSGTQRNPAQPGGIDLAKAQRNPVELGGTRRNPGEEPGGTRQNLAETWRKPGLVEPCGKKVSWRGGGWEYNFGMVYTPNPSPSTYFFSAGFQVSAKFPPGSAGFCQVSPGFVGFPTGFRQPRASARLARSRQVCVKFFISYSHVSAKPPPSPTQDPS